MSAWNIQNTSLSVVVHSLVSFLLPCLVCKVLSSCFHKEETTERIIFNIKSESACFIGFVERASPEGKIFVNWQIVHLQGLSYHIISVLAMRGLEDNRRDAVTLRGILNYGSERLVKERATFNFEKRGMGGCKNTIRWPYSSEKLQFLKPIQISTWALRWNKVGALDGDLFQIFKVIVSTSEEILNKKKRGSMKKTADIRLPFVAQKRRVLKLPYREQSSLTATPNRPAKMTVDANHRFSSFPTNSKWLKKLIGQTKPK